MIPTTIQLARKGPSVSRLVYGAWRLYEDPQGHASAHVRGKIDACCEMGITTFDHADIYGDYRCEELFGQALAEQPSLRPRLQLISKCGIELVSPGRPKHSIKQYNTSRAHIIASAENSLRCLRTDWLDVLLIHRPDPLLNPHEVAEAFGALHASGKVRYFGVSNFTPAQWRALQAHLPMPLVTNQIELSPMHLPPLYDGTLDQCVEFGVAPMAWSPLGGGRLLQEADAATTRLRVALQGVGKQLGGAPIDAVTYAWLLHHPAGVIPIIGSSQIDRIRNARSALELQMSREQWFTILRAATGHDVP